MNRRNRLTRAEKIYQFYFWPGIGTASGVGKSETGKWKMEKILSSFVARIKGGRGEKTRKINESRLIEKR